MSTVYELLVKEPGSWHVSTPGLYNFTQTNTYFVCLAHTHRSIPMYLIIYGDDIVLWGEHFDEYRLRVIWFHSRPIHSQTYPIIRTL